MTNRMVRILSGTSAAVMFLVWGCTGDVTNPVGAGGSASSSSSSGSSGSGAGSTSSSSGNGGGGGAGGEQVSRGPAYDAGTAYCPNDDGLRQIKLVNNCTETRWFKMDGR